MPSLGPLEILVVAVVALVVFGPQRLPEIARTVGRTIADLKRVAADVRAEFEQGLDVDEVHDETEAVSEDAPPRRTSDAGAAPGPGSDTSSTP